MRRRLTVEALNPGFWESVRALLPDDAARREVYGALRGLAGGDSEPIQDDVSVYHLHVVKKVASPVRLILGIGWKGSREYALAIGVFFVASVNEPTPAERTRDARRAWDGWQP